MEIASFILAAPENVKTLITIGLWINERMEAYRNASRLLDEWKSYGYDLYMGHLRLQIELATRFVNDATDEGIVTNNHIDGLLSSVSAAESELRSCGADDNHQGELNRFYYALTGRRRLKVILKDFKAKVHDFTIFMITVDMAKRTRPMEPVLLTASKFRTTSRYGSDYSNSFEGRQNIRTGAAEYKTSLDQIKDIEVLFERQELGDRSMSDVEGMVTELSQHLAVEPNPTTGILKCLGYRRQPNLEFVFEVPNRLKQPESLHRMLREGISFTNHQQIKLSLDLAEAVATTHATKLVHKSIRPETIIVFQSSIDSPTTPDLEGTTNYHPFLTTWSMMRNINDASGRTGSEAWIENIYRHPQRQGLQLETRYHIGHDIYSLGVTILELGLGVPFFNTGDDGVPRLESLYTATAEQVLDFTAETSHEQKKKMMLRPAWVQKVMLRLAGKELEERMGVKYAEVVRICLKVVEEGVGELDGKELRKGHDALEVSKQFRNAVVEPLRDILDAVDDDKDEVIEDEA